MNEMEKLQYVLFERLHRRAPGIDKLDRLWDAAVLLPLVRTPEGISVLFEERAHTLRSQPGEVWMRMTAVAPTRRQNSAISRG